MTNPAQPAGIIFIDGARFFAYHGVGEQERLVGNTYTVSLRMEVDLRQASLTDDLVDTVSYAEIYEAIRQEMAIPSHLLEHVAGRIAQRVLRDFPRVKAVDLRLAKRNPPMGGDVDAAGVELHIGRNEP